MKRNRPLKRQRGLRRGEPPTRRTPLRRWTPPANTGEPTRDRRPAIPLKGARRSPGAASRAQREKIIGGACIVCGQTKGLTPAHLIPRSLGGCDHPDCVPMCWLHHRAYDPGRLDTLPYLEPRWRNEIAHAVSHVGLVGTYRRLTAGRWPHANADPARG